jgi:hypothetical protein
MKQLNEVEHLKAILTEDQRQESLDYFLLAQIESIERLLETNAAYVKSPMAYNACAGLLNQLKMYAFGAFRDPVSQMETEKNYFDSVPLHGKP